MTELRISQPRNARPGPTAVVSLIALFTLLLNVSRDVVPLGASYGSRSNAQPVPSAAVEVTLRAAHTTISWDERNATLEKFHLPLLYLRRQRETTPALDRTLDISVAGLTAGTEMQVEIESLHADVATGQPYTLSNSFIVPAPSSASSDSATIQWTFDAATMPSDFYTLRVWHGAGDTLWESGGRPAFAALDTWDVAQNPYTVRVVYATLFPFTRGPDDLDNRLAPQAVTNFIADRFVPIIRDTWYTQVQEWGFGTPLHPQWDADKVVDVIITAPPFALMDGTGTYAAYLDPAGRPLPERRVWLRANYSAFQRYDTLENGFKSVFAHEFFHLMQWNVLLGVGNPANLWLNVFIEAQAELAVSVQHPQLELLRDHVTTLHSAYGSSANRFLAHRLTSSYRDLQSDPKDKYDATLYWRFLYEQYNDMDVVRAALEEMVTHYDVDIVPAMQSAMDAAFARLDGPFRTFEDSLIAFARANYALHLENGRCSDSDLTSCRGFYYDPEDIYIGPSLKAQLDYDGLQLRDSSVSPSGNGADYGSYYNLGAGGAVAKEAKAAATPAYRGAIPTSYGMDFIEVRLDPAVRDKPLAFTFQAEGTTARFSVQIWQLSAGDIKPRAMTPQPEIVSSSGVSLESSLSLEGRPTFTADRLAVIITRLDPDETADPVGAYQFTLDSYAEATEASAND